MKKIVLPVLLALSLVGCNHILPTPDPVLIVTPHATVTPPVTEPVNLAPVEWQVLNSDGVRQLADRIEQTGENVVLYVLDTDGFRALAGNLNEIKRYIREKNEAFDFMVEASKHPEPDASE